MTSALFDEAERGYGSHFGVLDCRVDAPWGGGMKISSAFSLGPLGSFSSHKSVFF